MKTLIQKIYVEDSNSFACRTYRTPDFETNWHKHVECELILITEGHGTALIGDHVGNYAENDIFFHGCRGASVTAGRVTVKVAPQPVLFPT